MNPIAALRARLKGRSDTEHEQAILRVVLLGWVILFMWARSAVPPLAENDQILLLGLLGFCVLAIGIFVAIWIWPAPNVPRRVLGMVADAGAVTFALFLAGESGVGLVGIYLFSIFGNGFRFGRKSLFVCQALCLLGFVPVILLAPWWREHPYIGSGLLCSILVLPLYVSTLLMRIWEARANPPRRLHSKAGRAIARVYR